MTASQDKSKEIDFFNQHAAESDYNVFSDRSNRKLVDKCLKISRLQPPARVADLGCGSGIFASILAAKGFSCIGVDIAHGLTLVGRRQYPDVYFVNADLEALPVRSNSLDGVLLSGVVHHFPDPVPCAREAYRVLKPGGVFVAFDPNRMNPFMYLYRDRSSPFYSRNGVTENERPVLAWEVKEIFSNAGFEVQTDFLSGLSYRYVASRIARVFLPAYNLVDKLFFQIPLLKHFSAFVLTSGVKKH